MSKVTDQTSGVVGGTMDLSRDTTIDEPDIITEVALARRHQADARGRAAAERIRAEAHRAPPPPDLNAAPRKPLATPARPERRAPGRESRDASRHHST